MRTGAQQSDVDLRRPERGVARRDEDVATRRIRESRSESWAVDRADDRDGAVGDRPERIAGIARGVGDRRRDKVRVTLVHRAQVGARAERPVSGGSEDRDPHVLVVVQRIERGVDGHVRVAVDGIDRWAVEGDDGDVLLELDRHARAEVRHQTFLVMPPSTRINAPVV